jgi:peptidoglycan hydrolase-like protein with peptidoglycan-binding domain
LVEDGKIGPKTVAAIKSFQTTHGLPVDGIAGDPLKTALAIAFQTTTGSPSPSSGAVASQAPAWGSGIPT